ncbi:hypothetical protein, partial [Clavibacter michiganensis]|uniref:hypothetical protein n=1 Tax=Clavibacter michiganensis TaxID=28447 RepID=UPI0029316193
MQPSAASRWTAVLEASEVEAERADAMPPPSVQKGSTSPEAIALSVTFAAIANGVCAMMCVSGVQVETGASDPASPTDAHERPASAGAPG